MTIDGEVLKSNLSLKSLYRKLHSLDPSYRLSNVIIFITQNYNKKNNN